MAPQASSDRPARMSKCDDPQGSSKQFKNTHSSRTSVGFRKTRKRRACSIYIYSYVPLRRIWHKVFLKVGIKGREGRACAVTHALLIIGSPGPKARCKWVIACLWFTKWNVNLCLLMLILDSQGHESQGQCESLFVIKPTHPARMPGGHQESFGSRRARGINSS